MKISKEMVYQLNNELRFRGYPFRYEYNESLISGNPHIQITLTSTFGVDSFIINPTKEFFEWLQNWFIERYGIELSCNNDRSILWSKTGWEEYKHE